MDRRDPFTEIDELFERLNRELDTLGSELDTPGAPDAPVDVVESETEVTVAVDLPGFDGDDVNVELRDDTLSITATRDAELVSDGTDDAGDRYHRRERQHGTVSRRIGLPAPVEPDDATAAYDDGVLTVTLPKRSASGESGHSIDVE